jgi:hypothetical protein
MSLGRNPPMSDAGTLIRPVSRATLPQEIVKALTDLIMKRVWKPGDLIPSEKELAIRFQVGRSTIREALKSLVVLGVLEARAGEGSFVREPTSEFLSGGFRWGLLLSEGNLDDFVDVRVLIEVECARRAAANRTDDLVSQLDATIEDMHSEPMDHGLHGQRYPFPSGHRSCRPEPHLRNCRLDHPVDCADLVSKDLLHPGDQEAHDRRASRDRGWSLQATLDAAGTAVRAHLVAAGQRLRTLLPARETRG